MKVLKVLTALAIVGLATSLAFADDAPPAKGEGKRGPGPGPMMDHLLPPRLLGDLNLNADQKTKYDALEASFKKDAETWDKAHPDFKDEMRKAHEAGDKDATKKLMEQRKPVMESRKGYVDQFRATLTDEQKAKLDKALEDMRNRMGKGPRSEKKDAPKPPPAE